jgi:hypothetical protein
MVKVAVVTRGGLLERAGVCITRKGGPAVAAVLAY